MARYTRNFEKNGIEIYFDKKPSEKVRGYLKANGWRWSSYKRCWYNYYSDSNLYFAESLCSEGSFEKTHFSYGIHDCLGDGDCEKVFFHALNFYNDYLAGRINTKNRLVFDQALQEYNLGVFNFIFKDSSGSEEKGIEYWTKCVEHSHESTDFIENIAVSMLGVTLKSNGISIEPKINMQLAISALQKNEELGNEKAKEVLSHVRRDGYYINNLDELSRVFDNNENDYILGLCFLYGYGVPQNCDNARQYLEDAFGWMFSYETYVRKHSLMKSSIKKEQELVVCTRLLSNYYAEIHYCGISTAQGECSITLWLWNKIDSEIKVDLTHVKVNGLEYTDLISLGSINEDFDSCFTISVNNTKYDMGLVIRKIEFFARVSCLETGEIFSSKKVIIEKSSTTNTFSASVL